MFSYNAWWGSRTPDKRSEIIPSSRITPDPLDSQIHDGASSLQFTLSCSSGFRSEDRNGRRRSLVLCSVTHFCVVFEVCVWIIARLEDYWPIIRFLTESVTYWFVYLLVFDKISDVMHLNKMSRTFSRNIGPQHKKYTAIYLIVHMGYFLSLCSLNPSWVFSAKKLIYLFHLNIEASPVWSSSRVW